jgi:hypothetical protein
MYSSLFRVAIKVPTDSRSRAAVKALSTSKTPPE